MSEKFVVSANEIGEIIVTDVETDRVYRYGDISKFFGLIRLLNEQQDTIEKQKRIIKSQDAEISRQYNLCLAMSGVLREEFGVYDVFDRSKDKRVK